MELEAMIDSSASNYIIPSFELHEGWFIFSSLSKFLSSITPNDMPLIYCILELLRDAFQSKVSLLQIILEALKVESGYICLVVIILIIAFIPLGYTIAWFCTSYRKATRVNEVTDVVSASSRMVANEEMLFQDECKEKLEKFHCRKRVYILVLQTFIIILILAILTMFIVNEQISTSINETPNVIKSALKDIEFFVKSLSHQLQSTTFEEVDKAREKIKIDLEDIDKLLGERITRAISMQTGLDASFESTAAILGSTRNISHRVQYLINNIVLKTVLLSTDAASKVNEIRIQLSVLQRQCNYRDRPLCNTLKVKSFEEMGFIEKLKILSDNKILQKLRTMSDEMHDNSLKLLTEELSVSKKSFRNYSYQLQQDTIKQSEEIMRQLIILRNDLNEIFNSLTGVLKKLLEKVGNIWEKIFPMMENLNDAGYVNWLAALLSCSSALVVTFFLLVPLSFSCCNAGNLAGITFIMASFILSIFSIVLGAFAVFEFLIGGHGEVFVCRALNEKPEYIIIGKLFDNPGTIYSQSKTNGIFAPFSNTSLTEALGSCERNKSSYETFQIDKWIDMKNSFNHENYPDLVESINDIRAVESPFISFTQRIQELLGDLLDSSTENFTAYRSEITQISPEKEMNNFIDQMQRVSIQIQDASTASRMANLATTAKHVQSTILQPIDVLKNEIIFHLTALELQIAPWMLQVREIELSFNKSQKFIDQQSAEICANYSQSFRKRLQNSMVVFKNEMSERVSKEFGCSQLFNIYEGIRLLICGHIIEPINGIFFLSFLVIFLWMTSTPLCLVLASTYDSIENIQLEIYQTSTHHSYEESRATVDEMVDREATNWTTRPQASIESEIDRSNW